MQNISILVTSQYTGHQFYMTLKPDSWLGLSGKWKCLPGYLPVNEGFFQYNSSGKFLGFYDRDVTIGEGIGLFFGGKLKTKIYMSLDDFTDDLEFGETGKGNIFEFGANKEKLKVFTWGYVESTVKWEITDKCGI